jgi:hypothetical protein
VSGHNCHPHCGCAFCCDSEAADERRDEYIAEFSPAVAKRLVGSEDFARDTFSDLPEAAQGSILNDAARFFERFHNAKDDPSTRASIGVSFYRELLPYVEAAAKEQAETEVAAEYDRQEAA